MPKNPTTIDQQVNLLIDRGLTLGNDEARLRSWLSSVGYYRLSGYWRYWQTSPGTGNNSFLAGTTVNDILDPVEFDSILRSLLMEGLADAEVALKSQLSNAWALHTTSVGYLQLSELDPNSSHALETIGRIRDAIADSKEEYIEHHRALGEDPPVWAALGVVSLGTVSKLYKVCMHTSVKQHVSSSLGLRDISMAHSALEGLTVLRNLCAHHHRLWNRTGLIGVQLPKAWKTDRGANYQRTPWALVELLRGVVKETGVNEGFSARLDRHLNAYPDLVVGLKKPRSTKLTPTLAYTTSSRCP